MSSRRYDFDDEDDDEFQRTLSNLVNQREDDLDDDDDVEVGGAPSEAASHVHFAPAEARPFLAEVAPPESTAALPVPTGIGRTAQDVLRQTAPAAGLLGWLVINQILTGCPGFLGSFEFKVDKEGTPLGPFEC